MLQVKLQKMLNSILFNIYLNHEQRNKLLYCFFFLYHSVIFSVVQSYLLKFADETFNKMGRRTINSNCFYSITLIYGLKALLEALSRWGILTIHATEANPRWNIDVFFFK